MEEEEEEEEREGEEEEKEAATRGNDSVFTFDFLPLESFSKLKTLPSMEEFLLLFTKFQFFPQSSPKIEFSRSGSTDSLHSIIENYRRLVIGTRKEEMRRRGGRGRCCVFIAAAIARALAGDRGREVVEGYLLVSFLQLNYSQ